MIPIVTKFSLYLTFSDNNYNIGELTSTTKMTTNIIFMGTTPIKSSYDSKLQYSQMLAPLHNFINREKHGNMKDSFVTACHINN